MTQLQDVDTAVSVCFRVKIDDEDLGPFSSCEGLGCEVVMETREEGGNNGYVWQLPTRLKYPNIKLTRPLGADTEKIAAWVRGGHRLRAQDRDDPGDASRRQGRARVGAASTSSPCDGRARASTPTRRRSSPRRSRSPTTASSVDVRSRSMSAQSGRLRRREGRRPVHAAAAQARSTPTCCSTSRRRTARCPSRAR